MPRFHALKLDRDSVFWLFCPRTIPGGEGSRRLGVRQAEGLLSQGRRVGVWDVSAAIQAAGGIFNSGFLAADDLGFQLDVGKPRLG